MGKIQDLTGKKFGRLTVIERAENKGTETMWLCKCDCGNTTTVNSKNLRRCLVQSCGCLRKEKSSYRLRKHGLCNSRLYRTWHHMIERCNDKNNKRYNEYGGRGITVCDEWLNDFTAFYEWAMTNGYADNLTIDRKDNNGNYEPSNCRWATKKEQSNNTRRNRLITYNGETHSISVWAEKLNVKRGTLDTRLSNGWTIEKALTTPVRKQHRKEGI